MQHSQSLRRPKVMGYLAEMNDTKLRIKSRASTKALSKDIRERLDSIDKDLGLKFETLDGMFLQNDTHPDDFHRLYIQPLLEAGVPLDQAFAVLIDGVLRPN